MSFFILGTLQPTEAKTETNHETTQSIEKVKKSEFKMKNSQVEVGSKWSAEKNFESATDVDGKKLLWKDIENKVEIMCKYLRYYYN